MRNLDTINQLEICLEYFNHTIMLYNLNKIIAKGMNYILGPGNDQIIGLEGLTGLIPT